VSTVVDPDRMIHPDEARATIFEYLWRLPAEQISLSEASWRVLADDLVAAEDQPPFPAATMDGYAVVADDPSPWREIVGRQSAGYVADLEVSLGTAAWITTGAPVPPGATAVVPVEATELADEHVIVHQERVDLGENIRPVGVDLAKGSVVLMRGSLLGAAEMGLLASLGVDPVPVVRRPRVGVLSTGNELVEPGETPGPGQIRDANRFSLIAALQEAGADVVWAGRGPDDAAALRSSLIERIADSDVVITSGGVSMGDLDLVKPLLSELVGFEVFIRPALRTMLGATVVDRPRARVRLDHSVRPSDRIEFQRAIARVDSEGHLKASTTGLQASSRLASLVGANALILVPPGADPIRAGSPVEAILVGPLETGDS
jgi:gephyrin